ncbi:hypothetical protein [Streptomyces marincola]|uniref:hypothetical protein n=1 Tax=Streptomyces marincola TaxID=2878388 RepID=UPI001CF1DFEE|nr:hypothetical protein [Streptomyces marincola]UCM90428.1 hypothetical protein LC193_22225 [Streptomyces marincola]
MSVVNGPGAPRGSHPRPLPPGGGQGPGQEADYPALGFVPCPGDQPVAAQIARNVREAAATLGTVLGLLDSVVPPGEWRGRPAAALKGFERGFRPKVAAAREAFAAVADVLEDWADHMREAQQDARALEAEARAARERPGLDAVRARARALAADYDTYGAFVAERLGEAGDAAPDKPGWLTGLARDIDGLTTMRPAP